MKLSFKSLLGVVPRGARSVGDIVTADVSVKKEEQTNLSTSDKLKLAKAAREGRDDKFTFFESDGKAGEIFARYMICTCASRLCPRPSCSMTWMTSLTSSLARQ